MNHESPNTKTAEKVTGRVFEIEGYAINDGPGIEALADFLTAQAAGIGVDLLPYHRYGITKYERLGARYALDSIGPPPRERVEALKERFERAWFRVSVGG